MADEHTVPVIVLGADHGGFTQKQELGSWLRSQGYQIEDCGAVNLDPDDDYPEFAQAVARSVSAHGQHGEWAVGILWCRSGAGMVMAANRFPAIRAVGAQTPEQVAHARAHNDANVLVLSGDWLDSGQMKHCIEVFLKTPFSAEPRHQRRIAQFGTPTFALMQSTPVTTQSTTTRPTTTQPSATQSDVPSHTTSQST